MNLSQLFWNAAQAHPSQPALIDRLGTWTYTDMAMEAVRIQDELQHRGVAPGSRVGIWLEKSGQAVAAMQAVMSLGAAYVPLDPMAPVARIETVIEDAGLEVLVTTATRFSQLQKVTLSAQQSLFCETATTLGKQGSFTPEIYPAENSELAYILYTSGSTGKPKGVCISHGNALAFVQWAQQEIKVTSLDCLANHAPFHFDLSVFDLYVAFAAGASVCLLPDDISFSPKRLVDLIATHRITVWYSVPTVLMLMLDKGELSASSGKHLRTVIFAGEPFPIVALRKLKSTLPDASLYNFYGPTETNVCTFYRVTEIAEARLQPIPIGQACSGNRVWARKDDGSMAAVGEKGELIVDGDSVMSGYWGRDPQVGPYATGDLVLRLEDDQFEYLGRLDDMVKVRGYRIELGDIEALFYKHSDVVEAAVVVEGSGLQAKLVAHLVCPPQPSLLTWKRYCAENLPRYMIIDRVVYHEHELPRTRNGKVNRRQMRQLQSV